MPSPVSSHNLTKLFTLALFSVISISVYITSNVSYKFGFFLPVLYIWTLNLLAYSCGHTSLNCIVNNKRLRLPLLLFFVMFVARVRVHYIDPELMPTLTVLLYLLLYLGLIVFVQILASSPMKESFLKYILKSYILFFLINTSLWALNVRNDVLDASYSKKLVSMLDLFPYREMLPLSSGVSDSSAISLVAAICALLLYSYRDQYGLKPGLLIRFLYISIFILAVFFMLITGNRISMLLLLVIIMLSLLQINKFASFTIVVCISFLLFPFIYLMILGLIERTNVLDVFSLLSRSGDISELLTLDNRVVIWTTGMNHFFANADLIEFLLGYGYYGQKVSGILMDYEEIFVSSFVTSKNVISVHSSILQIVTDCGFIGGIITVYYVFNASKKIMMNRVLNNSAIPSMMLLTLLGTGMIEVELATDTLLFWMFILMTTHYLVIENSDCSKYCQADSICKHQNNYNTSDC